jgi:hypothetical protein
MNAHSFQVVLRGTDPALSLNAPIAAARLISLMPAGWRGRLDNLIRDLVVIIETSDTASVDVVTATTESALADAAMCGWELVSCSAV